MIGDIPPLLVLAPCCPRGPFCIPLRTSSRPINASVGAKSSIGTNNESVAPYQPLFVNALLFQNLSKIAHILLSIRAESQFRPALGYSFPTRINLRSATRPIATNFSSRSDVSFRGEAEVGWAAEFAASVENDPKRS